MCLDGIYLNSLKTLFHIDEFLNNKASKDPIYLTVLTSGLKLRLITMNIFNKVSKD